MIGDWSRNSLYRFLLASLLLFAASLLVENGADSNLFGAVGDRVEDGVRVQVKKDPSVMTAATSSIEKYISYPVSPPPFPSFFPSNICEAAKSDFRSASGLFAIVTGMENSGTTITSSLLMEAPNLFGGFECGLLLAATPQEFPEVHPFYEWMLDPASKRQWGLTEEQREKLVRNSTCHAEQYLHLRRDSPLYQSGPNQHSWIVDKTPRYIYNLVEIMDRTPGVPVIVTHKTPEAQLASWRRRRDWNANMKRSLEAAEISLRAAFRRYPERIHIVNTTNLEEGDDPDQVMAAAFAFLGLQWNPEYKKLNSLKVKMGEQILLRVGDGFRQRTNHTENNSHSGG